MIPLADINLVDNVNLQARRRTHINSESEDDSDVPRHGREVLKEFHCLNIMLFNYTSMMVYSLLFFMQVDYVKNIVLMLGFALNPIVFNGYGQIKQSYEQTVTMGFKMQSEQGLRKMHIDWDVKSSSLRPSLALLDI